MFSPSIDTWEAPKPMVWGGSFVASSYYQVRCEFFYCSMTLLELFSLLDQFSSLLAWAFLALVNNIQFSPKLDLWESGCPVSSLQLAQCWWHLQVRFLLLLFFHYFFLLAPRWIDQHHLSPWLKQHATFFFPVLGDWNSSMCGRDFKPWVAQL